ncbi:MAG: methylated-DNA--[protein]-cysteine S-methyltransferase [Bacteroidia bacterium]
MNQVKIQYFKSSLGELIIGDYNNSLCLCDWRYRKMRTVIDSRIKNELNAEYVEEDSDISKETITQLNKYFRGDLTEFNLPLTLAGTDFQKSVWKELKNIPFGKTESYLSISRKLKNEKAIRAVAAANGANAIAIIVPCHRVIGSSGELTGYAGGLNTKKKLLLLEKSGVEQFELF